MKSIVLWHNLIGMNSRHPKKYFHSLDWKWKQNPKDEMSIRDLFGSLDFISIGLCHKTMDLNSRNSQNQESGIAKNSSSGLNIGHKSKGCLPFDCEDCWRNPSWCHYECRMNFSMGSYADSRMDHLASIRTVFCTVALMVHHLQS